MEKTMEFILNNKKVRYDGDPSRRLLDVLRDDFRITSYNVCYTKLLRLHYAKRRCLCCGKAGRNNKNRR